MNVNKGLVDYLFEKNIYVFDEYFKCKPKTDEEVMEHIRLIAEVQKILLSFNTQSYNGIKSYIGKEISKVQKSYTIIKSLNLGAEFSPLVDALDKIDKEFKTINFKKIVRRSIDRKEITIGKLDERNIRVLDEIEIGKIKKVAYSMIEDDAITYLRRVKKDEGKYRVDDLILEYIKKSGLDTDSYRYIKVMLDAPRLCIDYIEKNKSKLDKEELLKIMEKEEII